MHWPFPLQRSAAASNSPVQVWALHTVVLGQRRQAPLPLQAPSWPQVVGSVWLQLPFGSWPEATLAQAPAPLQTLQVPHSFSGSLPLETEVQEPRLAARLQAWQVPAHAPLQQTPSTQKPELHSPAVPHTWPLAFLATHSEPLHHALAQQSALEVQLVLQAFAVPHLNGQHDCCGTSMQLPMPLQ